MYKRYTCMKSIYSHNLITVPLFGYAVGIVHVGHQPIFPEDEPTLPPMSGIA